jgi:hypothetical protein
MNLKEQIALGKAKISLAHDNFIQASRTFETIKNPIEREHREILNKFRHIINVKIEAEHHCTKGCSPDLYDSALFTETGISMRIDANHPNDIVDTDWTWEEVETILASGTVNDTKN